MDTPPDQVIVITAVGHDQPGIIAALTQALLSLGGNLDDATMTRLHGAFATMLAARLPLSHSLSDIQAALAPLATQFHLTLTVQSVADQHADTPPDALLTVYGADKPGIVHAVTSHLADLNINITDMDTRLAGSPHSPVYIMLLEAATNNRDMAGDLHALRAALGVDITYQSLDAEAL